MQRIAFTSVTDDGQGHWVVSREITHDDGHVEQGVHIFPHDILEWRVAEYDLDPNDLDTVLDLVLAEPYLTEDDWLGEVHLYDAPDSSTARAAHVRRCRRIRALFAHTGQRRVNGADLFKSIKEQSPMHPEVIRHKRRISERARAERQRTPPRAALSDAERIETFRRLAEGA